jgi:hypothetical protein
MTQPGFDGLPIDTAWLTLRVSDELSRIDGETIAEAVIRLGAGQPKWRGE